MIWTNIGIQSESFIMKQIVSSGSRKLLLSLCFLSFLFACKSTKEGLKTEGNGRKLSLEAEKGQADFSITDSSVWIFRRGMTIGEAIQLLPGNQVRKVEGYGEFAEDVYEDYKVFDDKGNHLLTLSPKSNGDLQSEIERLLILDERFKTSKGINKTSTYAELSTAYKVDDYMTDIEVITLSIESLGAWFSINKAQLEEGWWNNADGKIDPSKIPMAATFDNFVIWWK